MRIVAGTEKGHVLGRKAEEDIAWRRGVKELVRVSYVGCEGSYGCVALSVYQSGLEIGEAVCGISDVSMGMIASWLWKDRLLVHHTCKKGVDEGFEEDGHRICSYYILPSFLTSANADKMVCI